MAEASRPSAAAEIPIPAEDRQRALDLLHRAEGLVALPDPDEAGRGLAAMRLAWAELQADVELDAALVQQFEAASDAVREAIASVNRNARPKRSVRTIAREQADRKRDLQEIEGLARAGRPDRRAQGPGDNLPPMPSSMLRRSPAASRTRAGRSRTKSVVLAEAAAARLETHTPSWSSSASGCRPDDVVARWRGCDAMPTSFATTPRRIRTRRSAWARHCSFRGEGAPAGRAYAKQGQDHLRRLQLCRHAETLAAAEQIALKAGTRPARHSLGARIVPHFHPKRTGRTSRRASKWRARSSPKVQELREADEWRWANLQVQEELCRQMEALKDEQDAEAAARQMRALQTAWKEVALAPPAKGEAMWRRFKAAQDEVFARTGAFTRTSRGACCQPSQEARALRACWRACRVHRLGLDRCGAPGPAGRVEDHRTRDARA